MWSLPEAEDLAADVRRLFDDLDRAGGGARASSSLHAPALDVFETPSTVEVVVDLPGVALPDIRVVIKHGALIVAGEKHPAAETCQGNSPSASSPLTSPSMVMGGRNRRMSEPALAGSGQRLNTTAGKSGNHGALATVWVKQHKARRCRGFSPVLDRPRRLERRSFVVPRRDPAGYG